MTRRRSGGRLRGRSRRRRGFILAASLGLILAMLAAVVIAQTVALSDLRFASRALLKTQAYFNARSGMAVTLKRLHEQPDLRRVESGGEARLPEGSFEVNIIPEVASAFGPLLAPLGADTPVYWIESTGRVPLQRGGTYSIQLTAVVRLEGDSPQILLWSENPGAARQAGL
ncbi:MAG TPA: hypothetical protein ENN74_02450 [Firmicutes bacterium]|nr:hypothetical protein [Bacillota bacterium]